MCTLIYCHYLKDEFLLLLPGLTFQGRWQESFLSDGNHPNHDQYGKQHIDNVTLGLK